MKKSLLAFLGCLTLTAASLAGCSSSKPAETSAAPAETQAAAAEEEAPAASGDTKIALITMDSIDQHWVTLNEGAQATAKEVGVTVTFKIGRASCRERV